MNEDRSRISWLYEQINYWEDVALFAELPEQDKILLAGYKEELSWLILKETEEKQVVKEEKSKKGKQAKWRGSNEERACAKITKGVVVGRSKAVVVNDKWYKTDCQKPPDVLSPPYSFEVKNRPFPKSISQAMTQAISNAPEGLTGKVWWRDRASGVRYIVEVLPDFIDDHIG